LDRWGGFRLIMNDWGILPPCAFTKAQIAFRNARLRVGLRLSKLRLGVMQGTRHHVLIFVTSRLDWWCGSYELSLNWHVVMASKIRDHGGWRR
jgi:hypothetical protein